MRKLWIFVGSWPWVTILRLKCQLFIDYVGLSANWILRCASSGQIPIDLVIRRSRKCKWFLWDVVAEADFLYVLNSTSLPRANLDPLFLSAFSSQKVLRRYLLADGLELRHFVKSDRVPKPMAVPAYLLCLNSPAYVSSGHLYDLAIYSDFASWNLCPLLKEKTCLVVDRLVCALLILSKEMAEELLSLLFINLFIEVL